MSASPAAVAAPIRCSYLVPVRWADGEGREELAAHLAEIAALGAEVIVVDGSEPDVFAADHAAFAPHVAAHLPPDPDLACRNGKVAGVMTAARRASQEALVIADDDVRHDRETLSRTVALLARHDLVRPQNYFRPLPWHARWDTARTLLNRAGGRDYPGTLGVRRSRLLGIGGYDGDVLFENLELIRTVAAAGGSEAAPLDLYVRRLPPSARHFLGQRVRQAYDDFALPGRMALWLLVVPATLLAAAHRRPLPPLLVAIGSVGLAERGRRRAGGRAVFPASASLLAPLWLLERGVCAWPAVAVRMRRGGVRYAGSRIAVAANSRRTIVRRLRRRPLVRP
ncbi:MAG TPA: glycosyltransferase family 2 protein [Solirubrobacterales bacterium]|nr:glycosyltransferase family 2 protein [Solirubrobacterales bacterium]